MNGAVETLDAIGSDTPEVGLKSLLGFEPTSTELRVVAQAAMDLHWTDSTTPEHAALAQALASDDATTQELHCLLLLACSAGNVAGKAANWLARRFPHDAVVEVTRILPAGGRASVHGRFGNPAEADELRAFISKWWGLANLYYGVNPRSTNLLGVDCH